MEAQSRSFTDRLVSKKDRREHRLSKASIGQPMKLDKPNDVEEKEAFGKPSMVMKVIVVEKDDNGYGLTVSGDNPVYVQSVKTDGAAQRAGVVQGDRIIKVGDASVTESNHVEVVRLIKGSERVSFTLLRVPVSSGLNSSSSDSALASNQPPANEFITGPSASSQRSSFHDQKVETIKKMLQQETAEVERIKEEYAKNPSPKLLGDLGTAQKLKQDLEKQLWKVESMRDTKPTAPADNQQHQAAVAPQSAHVTDVDDVMSSGFGEEDPSLLDMDGSAGLSATLSTDERDPTSREQRSGTLTETNLSGGHSPNPFASGTMVTGDDGSSADGLNSEIAIDGVFDNHIQGIDLPKPTTPVPGQNRSIMTFEEDDIANDEDAVSDHGPFNDFDKLSQRPAHLAVFVKYVMSSHDPSNLLFALAVESYRQLSSAKEMVRQADSLLKTYLLSNATMRVIIDDAITQSIQTTVHSKNPAEETLRGLFDPAVQASNKEVRAQLASYRIKREQGLGSLFGDEKLRVSDHSDNQQDCRIVDEIIGSMLSDIASSSSDELEGTKLLIKQDVLNAFLAQYGSKRKSRQNRSKLSSILRPKPQPIMSKSRMFGSQESILEDNKRLSNWFRPGKKSRQDSSAASDRVRQIAKRESKRVSKHVEPIWENVTNILQPIKVGADSADRSASTEQYGTPRMRSKSSHHSPVRSQSVPAHELHKADEFVPGEAQRLSVIPVVQDYSGVEEVEHGTVGRMVRQIQDADHGSVDSADNSLTVDSAKRDGKNLRHTRSGSFRGRRDEEKRHSGVKSHSDPDKNKVEQAVVQHSSSNEQLDQRGMDSAHYPDEAKDGHIEHETFSGDTEINVDASEQHWVETVPSSVIKNTDRQERKRQEVLNELIYTEQHHVRDLKILEKVFYEPFLQRNLLSQPELSQAFPNLMEILRLHREFNTALQEAKEKDGHLVKRIGHILLARFDGGEGTKFKEECAQYCGNQSLVLSMIKEKSRKDQKFYQFLEERQKQPVCRKLHLKDFIPMEFQRLTKYPMLLESLIKCTKKKHTDELDKIRKACDRCREILAFVNQTVKEAEDKQKMEEIQTNLDKSSLMKDNLKSDELVQKYKNIDLTKRLIVHHGTLTWRIGLMDKRKEIQLHCILFEDLMVLLQRQDERYVLKCQASSVTPGTMIPPFVELDTLIVRNVATDKRAFFAMSTAKDTKKRHSGPQMYEFATKSAGDVKQWMKLITETAATFKREATSSMAHQRRDGFLVAASSRRNPHITDINIPRTISAGEIVGEAEKNSPSEQLNIPSSPTPVLVSGTGSIASQILPVSIVDRLHMVQQQITNSLETKHRLLSEFSGIEESQLDSVLEMSSLDVDPELRTLVMYSLSCVDKLTGILNDCMQPENTFVQDGSPVDPPDRERSVSSRSLLGFTSETGYQTDPEPLERWATPVQHPGAESPTAASTATLNSVADIPLSESDPKLVEAAEMTYPASPSFASRPNEAEDSAESDSEQVMDDTETIPDVSDVGPYAAVSPDAANGQVTESHEASNDEGSTLSPSMQRLQVKNEVDTEGSKASRPVSSVGLASTTSVVQVSRMMELMISLQTQLTQLMHVSDQSEAERRKLIDENKMLREQLEASQKDDSDDQPPAYSDAIQGNKTSSRTNESQMSNNIALTRKVLHTSFSLSETNVASPPPMPTNVRRSTGF